MEQQSADLAELPEIFVDTTYRSLGHLYGEHREIFDELVAAVRDDQHTISGEAAAMLGLFGLLDSAGKVRSSVRPIVLAAAQGEGPALVSNSGILEYRLWNRPGPAPVPMTDQQKRDLITQCFKIADIFDTEFSAYTSGGAGSCHGPNAYYDRTTSGLYLEFYYGLPGNLWTPWGNWDFTELGVTPRGIEKSRAVSSFMSHLDADLLIPLQQNRFGAFGPVYKLHGIDGDKLPVPGEIRAVATDEEYEVAVAEWAAFGGSSRAAQSAQSPV